MDIKRSGSQPSSKGPAEWFTGDVAIDPLFEAPEPARVRGASVTSMAHPSSRSNIDRHVGPWAGAALGPSNRGDQAGRRDLVSAWREALAWSNTLDCDDAYRHSGGAGG
jgi:hypothetical protein